MPLTEAQVNKVAMIVGTTPTYINAQITSLGATFTTQRQTDVIALITEWDAGVGSKTTKIHPKESNRGVETDPVAAQNRIRSRIANLMEMTDFAYAVASSGIGTMHIG